MGHSRSPSRIASDVLATLLSAYPSHLLECLCSPTGGCLSFRLHRISSLSARYPGVTVGDVAQQLRCGVCRQIPERIVLIAVRETARVPLRGLSVY